MVMAAYNNISDANGEIIECGNHICNNNNNNNNNNGIVYNHL